MADYIVADALTLPRTLQVSGYKTAQIGKWHLGGGRDVDDAPSITRYGSKKRLHGENHYLK